MWYPFIILGALHALPPGSLVITDATRDEGYVTEAECQARLATLVASPWRDGVVVLWAGCKQSGEPA